MLDFVVLILVQFVLYSNFDDNNFAASVIIVNQS